MFETSSVRRNKQKFQPLTFMISATLHLAAIAAVTFVTVWDVEIPDRAPNQIMGFQVAAAPPPPMISKGSRQGTREPVVQRPSDERVATDVAPVEIPDIIAPLDTPVGTASGDGGSDEPYGDPAGAIGGDPDGDVHGVDGGFGDGPGLEGPYDVGDGVRPPVIVGRVEPLYPPLLIRTAKQGSVQLQCIISRSGVLTDIRVIHSSHPLFTESAIAAVRQWTFLPGTMDGRPVATRFDFTVKFNVTR